MLSRDEVESRFRALLTREGVGVEQPTTASVERAWAAMRRFGAEQVEDANPPEGDGVTAGFGVHEGPGGDVYFELTLTRQLVFYDGDEYDVMMHLYCSFQYTPTAALRALGEGESDIFGPEDEDWAEAMALRGFRGVRELGAEPVALSIEFTES